MKQIILLLVLALASPAWADSTINASNRYAYGANLGWINFRGDTTNGAVIGEYVCSGYIYSANVGWINLGTGSPADAIQYQNSSPLDFGVNHDGQGNLRGYAYGANIGWINFENQGAPKIDLQTGKLSGYAYGANVGWISLSNALAYVQTDVIAPGLTDTNGLPFAWEYQNFGGPGVDPNADPDGDGMTNLQEYQADTDPNSSRDNLKIISVSLVTDFTSKVTWASHPSRNYFIQKRLDVNIGTAWLDSGIGMTAPDAGTTTMRVTPTLGHPILYYRVQAVRPLAP